MAVTFADGQAVPTPLAPPKDPGNLWVDKDDYDDNYPDGYRTQGEYHVNLPDGRVQIVNYRTVDSYSGKVDEVCICFYMGHFVLKILKSTYSEITERLIFFRLV